MAEHTLLDRTFQRTADGLLEQLRKSKTRFEQIHIWLFEEQQRRQVIAGELAKHGIQAEIHSAYKPLVHFFLEQVSPNGLTAIDIAYPVHPCWPEQRFRLEAYPLAGMFPNAKLNFEAEPASPTKAHANTWYRVQLHYGEQCHTHNVFAPNLLCEDPLDAKTYKTVDVTPAALKVLRQGFTGQTICRPSAWLMTRSGDETIHTPLQSAYQQCYDAIMAATTKHEWPHAEPYFDRLIVRADLPGIEQPLNIGHETISTTEAMHEEVYFSLLEFFQLHSGREPGSRGLQPGQIIPDIRLDQENPARVRMHYEDATTASPDGSMTITPPSATDNNDIAALAAAAGPLTQDYVRQLLSCFKGDQFGFWSRQRRIVQGVYIKGTKPAVFISGGQHANETTGVVGALRAAAELSREPQANFVVMPLENPDGYALHASLRTHNPGHMHHAARYSALGDDIEYRQHSPWYERNARHHAFEISHARLHLNLHGYPAHEWTRPCTGYLPRGFELWSIPKGFFLILRYLPDVRKKAQSLLEHVTEQLAQNRDLLAYNTRQLDLYQQHADTMPFEIMNGMPYMETAVEDMACDVTLVTEFPDETIYGEEFVFGHSVQAETVLAATRWWWEHT